MEENKSKMQVVTSEKDNAEDTKKQNEQLTNYCNQLLQQRNQLAQQLNAVQNILNKLPWLFKVVEFKDNFNQEFVTSCIKEIEAVMTPPAEEDNLETDTNTKAENGGTKTE